MNRVSERIERLIVRRLDGELTVEEGLELDRELLRSPEARALLESYQSVDDRVAGVLSDCLGSSDADAPFLFVPAERRIAAPRPAWRRDWMTYASGLAACLAIVIFVKTPGDSRTGVRESDDQVIAEAPRTLVDRPRVGVPRSDTVGVWPVSDGPSAPQQVDRVTDRNFIVVPGNDGNFYLLGVDHVQEIRRPATPLRGAIHDPI